MSRTPLLTAALRRRHLVEFTRPCEQGSVEGYVLKMGPRFILMALVEERARFNGFTCFHRSDVRELRAPHPYGAFVEAALRKRGRRMPRTPRIDLASIGRLLASASRAFPLVTIHREAIDPSVCQIGRVVRIRSGRVALLEISADATWDAEPTEYRLKEITRVDFGGDYEDALHLVGGAPPGRRRRWS